MVNIFSGERSSQESRGFSHERFKGKDIKYLLSLIKKNKNNNKFKTYDINISNYIYILKFNMNILKLIKKSTYKKVKMKLSNDENILVDSNSIASNFKFNITLEEDILFLYNQNKILLERIKYLENKLQEGI